VQTLNWFVVLSSEYIYSSWSRESNIVTEQIFRTVGRVSHLNVLVFVKSSMPSMF
jgi:hypothetical protein